MAQLTEETLRQVCETLVIKPQWSAAAKTIGVAESTLYLWLSKSRTAQKANDQSSAFLFTWQEVPDWFHAHCGRARKQSLVRYEGVIRDQAMNGVAVPVLGDDGQPVRKIRDEYRDLSDEDLDNFGIDRSERYERNPDGSFAYVMRVEQLPATTRNLVLSTMRDYQQTTNVNVTSRGVMHVVGEARPKPLPRIDTGRLDLDQLRQLAQIPPKNPVRSGAVQKFGPGDSRPENVGKFPRDDVTPRPAPSKADFSRRPSTLRADRNREDEDYIGRGRDGVLPGGFKVR